MNQVTTTVRTKASVTDADLVTACQSALGPIFDEFQAELLRGVGKQLTISISVDREKTALQYWISPIQSPLAQGKEVA